MDHIQLSHVVPPTVKSANLGKWFPPWTVSRETWCDALNSHVSGVSTDVLLFSKNGAPLIHHYRVFGQSGAHASLCGRFIMKLRAFTVQAEAEAKWACNRTPARSASLPVGSDHQHGVRQREPDDDSTRCKTRRVMPPSMSKVSAVNTPSASVSSSVPHSHLYGGRPPLLPVTLRMPNFADKDFIASVSQSILVATQENPASPASRSSTLYYDLDAISSGDSVSGDSALRSSPVSMVDQELAVISVHSSDSDHDLLDELFQFRSLNLVACS